MTLLDGKFEQFWVSMGVCCSSWIATSRGSTGRCFISPMGDQRHEKVRLSNCMVSRTLPSRSCLLELTSLPLVPVLCIRTRLALQERLHHDVGHGVGRSLLP